MACFPHTSLFDASAWGNPLEFLDETYPAKTRDTAWSVSCLDPRAAVGMGIPMGIPMGMGMV